MVALTREEVVPVLGPSDETLIAEIVATGATLDELTAAWAWVNNDEALIGEGCPLPAGRVGELVELLAPEDDEP